MKLILLLLLAGALCSCTGIPAGWQEAKRVSGDPVSGAWSGTWQSAVNGHRGGLKCVAVKKSPGVWEMRYRASWARVLCAGFTLDAAVQPLARDGWSVQAAKNLGPLYGGEFRSTGTVRGETFSAAYDSQMDRGTMVMQRVR
jgi:hypothetical protein